MQPNVLQSVITQAKDGARPIKMKYIEKMKTCQVRIFSYCFFIDMEGVANKVTCTLSLITDLYHFVNCAFLTKREK